MNVIRLLDEKKGDFPTEDDEAFAETLQLACLHGHRDVVQHLLRPDTGPRKADKQGCTLLYDAHMSRERKTNPQDVLPPGYLPSPGERTPFPPPACWSATDKSPYLSLQRYDTRVNYIGKSSLPA